MVIHPHLASPSRERNNFSNIRKVKMDNDAPVTAKNDIQNIEEPQILEEIMVEELSIDGVCGVY
jgi:mycofactocin precursor